MKKEGKNRELYFIGIGGSGMCPLAILAAKSGFKVSGIDQQHSKNINRLKNENIPVIIGSSSLSSCFNGSVIVSSAIKPSHSDLILASKRNLTIMHRSDLLNQLMKLKLPITVAGTHGKTSTTALIAHLLRCFGEDPDAFIGAEIQDTQKSWMKGSGPHFVAEADESDGSFLKYKPQIGVLTNIDNDHLDFYGSSEKILEAFSSYVKNISSNGFAIIGTNQQTCKEIFDSTTINKISFGTSSDADLYACNISSNGPHISFDLIVEGEKHSCCYQAFGRHNILNALAAIATLKACNKPVSETVKYLSSFPGVARRLCVILDEPNFTIIDDYAHNPGKISASINAIRASWPSSYLIVIFQPHRYSRLTTMYKEFTDSFTEACHVFVTDIFAAGEAPISKFTPKALAYDIAVRSQVKTSIFESIDQIEVLQKKTKKKNIVILTVGAGNISNIAYQIKEKFLAQHKQNFSS